VNEAVDRDDVLPRALEIAREIAVWSAPASVAHTKRVIWENLGEPDPGQAARNESRAFWWLGRQPDAREGVVSFLEKRAPAWTLTPSSGPDDD
jgi:enoyl-CoA hydratase/carnithine racemase